MHKNPILIVDDDEDDLYLIREVFKSLEIQNELHFFHSGEDLRVFLLESKVSPFLILCDVNLPRQDGFAVRTMLATDDRIKYHSVPFIFWSTAASEKQVQQAYDLPAQGFFIKSSTFDDLRKTISEILSYWTSSLHPKRL